MKSSLVNFLIVCLFLLASTSVCKAQSWYWQGCPEHPKIKEYIQGAIDKMKTLKNCTSRNYGRDKEHQNITVLSCDYRNNRVIIDFKFTWRINWWIGTHSNFSFTLSLETSENGCNTRATYLNESGSPMCRCDRGDSFDLGCISIY